jgi:hypothetical protein
MAIVTGTVSVPLSEKAAASLIVNAEINYFEAAVSPLFLFFVVSNATENNDFDVPFFPLDFVCESDSFFAIPDNQLFVNCFSFLSSVNQPMLLTKYLTIESRISIVGPSFRHF